MNNNNAAYLKNTSAFVEINDLCFAHREKPIFRQISLDIPEKKITAIMGPSGTGKTTLLKLIGGQLKPQSGTIYVKKQPIHKMNTRELNSMRRHMGMLFQEGALFSDLNVFENVAFLLRAHTHLPEAVIHNLVLMKLEAVGLRGAAHLPTHALSGGMARRVALARAIMLDPELMMYDEPFAGQDPINRGVLLKLIRELNDSLGLTSIIVTHDVNEVLAIADWLVVLAGSKIIASGTPQEIVQSSSPAAQQFVKGQPDGPVPFHYPARPFKEELELC